MSFDLIVFFAKSSAIALVSGFIVGYLSMKVSKLILFFIVLIFILSQLAIFNGFIEIEWLTWKDTAVEAVRSAEINSSTIYNIALRNLPFTVAAIIGFIIGFKKG